MNLTFERPPWLESQSNWARRLPGERVDLWVTRHNYRAPRPYWGFWQFDSANGESLAESADAADAVAAAGAVLFLGGNASASAFVVDRWPRLANRSFQARTARVCRRCSRLLPFTMPVVKGMVKAWCQLVPFNRG